MPEDEIFGCDELSVKWVNSYLSDRSQQVMIGGSLSKPVELQIGSPQGSILSPTLFIILIADMELYCPNAVLSGYADDTSCTVAVQNIEELKEECETSVNNLLQYMAINKLACNDDKTHIIVIKHGQGKEEEKLTFKIGGAKIKESTSEKLLGAWIKNDLSWSTHIEKTRGSTKLQTIQVKKNRARHTKVIIDKSCRCYLLLNH